jgi:hypothetical protein
MTPTLLAFLALLGHWGEVGHRLIGSAAASALPADTPAFFRDAADQLSYLNPEPDPRDRFAYLDSLRAHGVDAAGARMLRDIWWTAWVTSSQTSETVESVIQHDIAARGGADKIHALRTVRQSGLLINGKDTSRLVIESKLPDAMRMEITSGGKTLVRAYDGRTGWQKVPDQNTTNLMTPAEQKNISHEADLMSGLVDYVAKGNKVALTGTELIEGHEAYKVQVTLRDSTVFTYFIDRTSWLPVKWQGGPWETMYRSFIDVGGVKIPSRFETTQRGSTVATPTVLLITTAVANPNLPDSRFAPPSDAK